jgi:septal ring factor EnvC (AmiA/AmiB activator)
MHRTESARAWAGRAASFVALSLIAVAATGCNKKIDECNALIKQMNEASTAVQAQTTSLSNPKEAEQALTQLASTTKEQTDKIAAVTLTVPELAGFSKEYQTMLGEMVASASAMGKAAGEMTGIQEAEGKDRQAWATSTGALRAACAKAAKDCQKLGDTLNAAPNVTGQNPEQDAKALEDYAKSISAIEVDDQDLKKAVGDVNASLTSFAGTLRKVDAATKAVEKATQDMKATADKEPPLIDKINGFCQAAQ